ncbi:MAG TPA: carboxypeptidase-like regulatory domain-containing protein [Planctomycetota bacterium]|nr:carboxypeptidase-like regulatory domain-containing protein [Planctomycetota bacterium]
MRAVDALVGCVAGAACGALIAVLLRDDSGAGGVRPSPAPASPTADHLPAASSEDSAPDSAPSSPADAPPPAVEPLRPGLDARLGLLVFGAVDDASGVPAHVEGERIRFVPDDGPVLDARIDVSGRYALPGLHAGTWTVATECEGYRPTQATLALDGAQLATRFDILVQAAPRLIVLAETPDGLPLQDVLREPYAANGDAFALRLGAIATTAPPDALQPDPSRLWNGYGVGRFHDRNDAFGLRAPDIASRPEALGWLDVRAPMPVFVSLILAGVVLETQRVEAGQEEVRFRLEATDVTARLAGMSARFVDAFTLEPLEGVEFSLNMAELDHHTQPSDAAGLVHAEGLVPGRTSLQAQRQDYEMVDVTVTLAAGRTTDLGDIALAPAVSLGGMVLDEQGRPLAAALQVTVVDAASALPIDYSTWRWSSGGDGQFELAPLGRRRYLLRVDDDGVTSVPLLVDARGGDVSGLLLRAEAGQPVYVRCAWPGNAQRDLRLRSAEAALWDENILRRPPDTWTLHLGAGRYLVECCDGDDVLQSVPFEVAGKPVHIQLTGP